MEIPLCSLLLVATCVSAGRLGAQGNVLTVDDGPNDYGVVWLVELNPDGSIDSLSELPTPEAVSDFDAFGAGLAPLGDLDGNGTPDLVAGAPGDDRAGKDRGSAWLLLRGPGGKLAARVPLRPGRNFEGASLDGEDRFGLSTATFDLDGDGRLELAVGAARTSKPGSLWILSLSPDGAVLSEREIGLATGGFGGGLEADDSFGSGLASIGDRDGNGVPDLAVGAPGDDDGASNAGAVWLLDLAADGTVIAWHKISAAAGGFAGPLLAGDLFGSSVTALGDLDGNGVTDLAVGAPGTDDGAQDSGAVWVLRMNADGTVQAAQKISQTQGGLGAHADRYFGSALAPLGDLNGDGVPDLAVGARGDAARTGALFVLLLDTDGTVQTHVRHSAAFPGLANGDAFGASLALLGDLDQDGRPDLAVGATSRNGSPTNADYTQVQAALAAAVSGDTILIHGGIYGANNPWSINGKSLTLQALHPQNVRMLRGLLVSNLSASQSVRLSGLRFDYEYFYPEARLRLAHDAGTVWVDDCVLGAPSHVIFATEDASGLEIDACSAVVMNRTRVLSGGRAPDVFTSPAYPPAARLSGGSALYAHDCSFLGKDAAGRECGDYDACGTDAGAGLLSESAGDYVFLSGCTVKGGDAFNYFGCQDAAIGLEMAGTAQVLDSTLSGGASLGSCPAAPDSTGNVGLLAGQHLSMAVNNPTREGEVTLFTFEGPPGAAVSVRYSLFPGVAYRPGQNGWDLLGSPRVTELIGVIGASGRLVSGRHLGLLPPAVLALHLYVQASSALPFTPQVPWPSGKSTVLPNPDPVKLQLGTGAALLRLDGSF